MNNKFIIPEQNYFALKECCELKNLSYKSALKTKWKQPKGGKPDIVISNKRMWARQSVLEWLEKSDDQLRSEYFKKGEHND